MKSSHLTTVLLLVTLPAMADFEAPSSVPTPTMQSTPQRPWDLSVRASIGRNDNVQLVPDSTFFYTAGGETTRANHFTLQGDGVYRFHNSATVVSGLTLSVSSLWHEDKMQSPTWKFSDYNFYTINPGIFSSYRHAFSGRPATLTVSYDFLKEDGHNEELHALGLSSHNVKVSESVELDRNLVLTASLNLGWDDFEVKFPLTPSMNRDGNRTALDLGLRYWISGGLHNASAGIGYINNDAKGQDFNYDGYNLRLRFETGALRPVWLAAEIKYSDRDYTPITLGRNEQQITTALLQMLWPIDRNWSADLYYKHDRYDSNQPDFETEATQYGVGVNYKF